MLGQALSPYVDNLAMSDQPQIPWPETYLDRLYAVTAELREFGGPMTPASVTERFTGVSTEQVEAILAALVLFGRAEKKGAGYQAIVE